MKKVLVATIFIMLVFSYYGQDEMERHGVGIRAGIQTAQLGIQVPIWAGDSFTIAPMIGFSTASDSGSDLILGLAFRKYLNNNQASPFIGIQYNAAIASAPASIANVEPLIDHIVGLLLGGDFFFSEQFSLGAEVQLNYTKSDDNSIRFGVPGGETFNTATGVNASFYF